MVLRQSIVVNCCQVELLEGKLDWELAGQDRKEEGERKTPPASRPVFDLIWYKKFLAWGPFPGGELTVPQAQKVRWACGHQTTILHFWHIAWGLLSRLLLSLSHALSNRSPVVTPL